MNKIKIQRELDTLTAAKEEMYDVLLELRRQQRQDDLAKVLNTARHRVIRTIGTLEYWTKQLE